MTAQQSHILSFPYTYSFIHIQTESRYTELRIVLPKSAQKSTRGKDNEYIKPTTATPTMESTTTTNNNEVENDDNKQNAPLGTSVSPNIIQFIQQQTLF